VVVKENVAKKKEEPGPSWKDVEGGDKRRLTVVKGGGVRTCNGLDSLKSKGLK